MAKATVLEVLAAPSAYDDALRQFARTREKIVRRWNGCVDPDVLEDLRQVARIATWVALDTYNPDRGAALASHVYRCVVNAVLDAVQTYLRQHLADAESLDALPVEIAAVEAGLTPDAGRGNDGSVPRFVESIEWDDLREAFLRLDARDQVILAGAYGAEEADARIAARVGMTVTAVTKRRQRALKRLAAWLLGAGARPLPRRRGRAAKESC